MREQMTVQIAPSKTINGRGSSSRAAASVLTMSRLDVRYRPTLTPLLRNPALSGRSLCDVSVGVERWKPEITQRSGLKYRPCNHRTRN